jgi:hypothetical protein
MAAATESIPAIIDAKSKSLRGAGIDGFADFVRGAPSLFAWPTTDKARLKAGNYETAVPHYDLAGGEGEVTTRKSGHRFANVVGETPPGLNVQASGDELVVFARLAAPGAPA